MIKLDKNDYQRNVVDNFQYTQDELLFPSEEIVIGENFNSKFDKFEKVINEVFITIGI